MKVIKRPEEFKQVCVWPSTIIGEEHKEDFIKWLKDEFDTRGVYLEDIQTLPSKDEDDDVIPDTGGRNDVIFAVHTDDIMKFAAPRFQYGIRWIEDVFGNMDRQGDMYYPEYLRGYCSWDYGVTDEIADEVIKSKLN